MSDLKTRLAAGAASTAIALFAALPQAAADGVELTAVAGLQPTNPLTMSFVANLIEPLKKAGAGVVTIKYAGGPEVVPPTKAAKAVERGQFDMLNSPVSYYIGTVPEGYAMLAANVPVAEIRKNGGWELLNEVFNKKAGSQLIAWAEAPTKYNMYLSVQPKFDKDGVPDLSGIKMRATGTYRPLFRALGASTINMKESEIYTGLERGVVQGFGWPETGVPALGLHKLVKHRINPGFYATNHATTINLNKWKSLSQKQKDVLMKAVAEYEKIAPAFMAKHAEADTKTLRAAGVKEVNLEGKAANKYLSIAYGEIWKELGQRSDYAEKLRAKLYRDPAS
jgi:TRAP-type C4-dicarboxylate transport system substrate-binding protein